MATLRLFNYIYGNYNDQRVRNTTDLSNEFPANDAVFTQENVNISYNDGLMISLTVNVPDSLVESINYATLTDGNIIRPFYVLSYMYLRKDQYELSMKIDSVLYKLNFIKNTRGNVFRGFVNQNDNTILNNEGVEVTKVKVGEVPLDPFIGNNTADMGWYAVYMDRKLGTSSDTVHKLEFKLSNNEIIPDETYATVDDYSFNKYLDNRTLYFDLVESHAAQNTSTSGSFNSKPIPVFKDLQVYKLSQNGVQPYGVYTVKNNKGSLGSLIYFCTAAYTLDGRLKTPYAVSSDPTNFIYSSFYNTTSSAVNIGIYKQNPDGIMSNIKDSGMLFAFNTKKADMNARQSNMTTVTVGLKTKDQLLAENGKILKIGTDFFKVASSVTSTNDHLVWGNSNANIQAYLKNKIFNNSATDPLEDTSVDEINIEIKNFTSSVSDSAPADWSYSGTTEGIVNHVVRTYDVTFTLEPVSAVGTGLVIGTFGGGAGYPKMIAGPGEEPFKLILIPYGKVIVFNGTSGKEKVVSESLVKNIVSNLIYDYPGFIYDVQRLPYSSINLNNYFILPPDGYATIDVADEGEELYILKEAGQPYAPIFTAYQSNYSFEIDYSIINTKSGDRKLDATTKFANLVSPSHKTLHTYEYVKNGYGAKFIINIDLKPYTPYINVDFKIGNNSLYYSTFNDGRGLNIAEDCSLTMFTDQFQSYIRNNSTYLNSFNSQQEYQQDVLDSQQRNETTRNEIDKEQAWAGYGITAAGQVVNTAIGAGIGVATGGIGAAMGGISAGKAGTGIITGAVQTHVDNMYRDKKLAIQQGYAKDQLGLQQAQAKEQFQFSLQNLQNRPARLDKVSGITSLHRKVPYLALYDTTLPEKERLQQYFNFNGYNINKIDVLGTYIDFDTPMSYLKASIIESNESVNNTILQDINQRLSTGVYFMKGN